MNRLIFNQPDRTFSLLEFGVASGNRFTMLLHFRDYWASRLHIASRIMVMGFDTFEGLPSPRSDDIAVDNWREGDFPGDLEELQTYCETQFDDFRLLKGLFKDTLAEYHSLLSDYAPAFVSIDCDYYSSTMEVLDGLPLDKMPHGCIFYFDDVSMNLWSDKTGELRAIAEVNQGRFGDHIQLIEYPMWLETLSRRHYKQVYRLVNLEEAHQQELSRGTRPARVRAIGSRGSPL